MAEWPLNSAPTACILLYHHQQMMGQVAKKGSTIIQVEG